ncbi:MAG: GH3 auxin-responsive promoter family protein [Planctomycetales bacterium]
MRRLADRFAVQLRDPRGTQARVLQELLALNSGSRFSTEHGLGEVHSPDQFRRRLPITTYADFRPYIDRLREGDLSALLGSANPLLMFALTSGTTSGAKYIPITRRFLEDYRRGWRVWGIRAFDAHPALHTLNIVQLASDHDQFRTPGGHPCGNISGLVSSMQSPLVKSMYAVPALVAKIGSPEAKYYVALRGALTDRHVGLIMTANPSTLVHLARLGDAHKAELIRDIADGTLTSQIDVSPELRGALRSPLGGPDRRRARELEAIVSRTGHLSFRDCWPRLALLAVWTGGSAAAYTPALKQYFGELPIRDHGLSASEGRMTIPFRDDRPDGLLDVATHYFEFIPESEHGAPQPTVLEAHELQEGENYFILLTTSSGLCRYDIQDVVRCTGHEHGTPLLRFLNKGAHIASITGEKISESQVVAAVSSSLREFQLAVSHFTVAPVWGDPPGYRLLVEGAEVTSPEIAARLCDLIDKQLQQHNLEYGDKRRSGRLGPLQPALLPPETWNRFIRQRLSRLGGSVEQYKHPCLVPDLEFCERLRQQVVCGPSA